MVSKFENLSVLIVGCGSIGRRHARILHGLGVKDIRACDSVESQRNALLLETPVQLFTSYEQGLASRPATVFICTAPQLHISMALQAVEAGAHVFCEKPLSDSSVDFDKLSNVAQLAQRQIMTGLCFRYHKGLTRAKSLLASGQWGRLAAIRSLVGEHLPSVRPDYRTLFSATDGGAFDLTHEVDLAVWFSGRAFKQVRCLTGNCSEINIAAPDIAVILIEFEDRCMASIHLDFFQQPRRRSTELICTQGVITVEFSRWDRCTVSFCGPDSIWTHEQLITDRDDMFRAEDTDFLDAVIQNKVVSCGIVEARQSVEIIEIAKADSTYRKTSLSI